MRTPRPPTLIATMSTTRPKVDQWVCVGTVTRPVTHMALTAVKSASTKRVRWPETLEIGSSRMSVNSKIIAVNTNSARRAGEVRAASRTRREMKEATALRRRRGFWWAMVGAPTGPPFDAGSTASFTLFPLGGSGYFAWGRLRFWGPTAAAPWAEPRSVVLCHECTCGLLPSFADHAACARGEPAV